MPKLETRTIRLRCFQSYNAVGPFSSRVTPISDPEIIIHTIYGDFPGPTLYVGGCMHGDELNGTTAILQILQIIQCYVLRGTVVVVPIQSPVAFNFRERLNPFDPIDPDWVFPGREVGTYSQVLKYNLLSLSSTADCVIDCHSAGRGGANVPMVYCPPENGNKCGDKSLELAISFGGERIVFGDVDGDYDWPVQHTLPFVAVREGRMGIYTEAGTGGSCIPEKRYVRYFVNGIVNVMKAMNMVTGVILEQGERAVVHPRRREVHVVATREGISLPVVEVGCSVSTGDCVAEVWDYSGQCCRLLSPISGLVVYYNRFGSVGSGDRLATISPHL